jgi:hypothetical protein
MRSQPTASSIVSTTMPPREERLEARHLIAVIEPFRDGLGAAVFAAVPANSFGHRGAFDVD